MSHSLNFKNEIDSCYCHYIKRINHIKLIIKMECSYKLINNFH